MNKQHKRKRLRAEALNKRDRIPPDMRSKLSQHIISQAINRIERDSIDCVMLYLSMGSEVETDTLLDYLLTHGKIALAPVTDVRKRTLTPYRITNPKTDLVRHPFGMLEPNRDTCQDFEPDWIDLVIVPGIAFDSTGHRIGYGYGFYDRFLPRCSHANWVGIAYEAQMVKNVYPEKWDVPLHQIYTDVGRQISK